MQTSKEGLLTVLFGDSWSVNFYPADWSIGVIPDTPHQTQLLSKHLFNNPSSKHVTLMLSRSRKEDRIANISNIGSFYSSSTDSWQFLDTVSISYDKPSTCSNSGLLPISEFGFLFYKGVAGPNTAATSWFRDDRHNASNLWDVSVGEYEKRVTGNKSTHHQRFSWELNLLMYSVSKPMACRSFIYMPKLTESEATCLALFCKEFHLKAQIITKNSEYADKIVEIFNKCEKKSNKR